MFSAGLGGGGGGFPGGAPKKQKGPHLKPQLLVCYLCGQQFGTSSLGIHIPQCYSKKTKQWEAGDPETRGKRPRDPATVDWQASTTMSKEEYNDRQFQDFTNNLEPCPQCGRKFLPDRLVVHLRSCNPGASGGGSKPVNFRPQSQQGGGGGMGDGRAQTSGGRLGAGGMGGRVGDGVGEASNPLRNRLPGGGGGGGNVGGGAGSTYNASSSSDGNGGSSSTAGFGGAGRSPGAPSPSKNKFTAKARVCIRCSCAEYDSSAKFCRDCGTVLDLEAMEKCESCEEPCPADARFCPTCGNPFKDASAPDRTLNMDPTRLARISGGGGGGGGGSSSPPTSPPKRPGGGGGGAQQRNGSPDNGADSGDSGGGGSQCPNCGCDVAEDGNFCDNCGCRLGGGSGNSGGGIRAPATPTKEVIHMRCEECDEAFEDDGARFCEECGGPLVATVVTVKGVKTWADDRLDATQLPEATTPGFAKTRGGNNGYGDDADDDDGQQRYQQPRPPPGPSGGGGRAPLKTAAPPRQQQQQQQNYGDDAYGGDDGGERLPCAHCGRSFAPEALARHEDFCQRQKAKPRKVFDSRRNRMEGTDSEGFIRTVNQRERSEAARPQTAGASIGGGVSKWKQQSMEFRKAMRAAREVDSILKAGGTAKDLPPPTYSDNSHLTPCPHCGRRFAAETAARHIPSCATTINRPKGPPVRRR